MYGGTNTWILLWAENSAVPQSGKICRRISQNTEDLKKDSGSKILKNRDDEMLDHTQANCLCITSSFPGTHSFHNPTLEPSRSHCHKIYKQTCAQAKASKNKPRSMRQGTPLSLRPCLQSSLTKWVALQDISACLRTSTTQ